MLKRARLGMALFLLSEAVLFFFLITGVVYFKQWGAFWGGGSLYTILFAVSGITMWRAASGAAARLWLVATILLGLASLSGLSGGLLRVFAERNQESALFTLFGCHQLHVALGIVLLGIALWCGQSVVVKTIALYWYFVVAVWIVIIVTANVWTLV